jgi:glycosyltransferase involved in cell wall biosynthesis
MIKKKILIFIDWYKPGYKAGGPIRSISNMVDFLYVKSDFYIVTRNTDYLENIAYVNIDSNKWNTVDNSSVYYLSKENTHYKNIKNIILEVKPDIIYANSLYSPYFTLIPLYIAKKLNIKSVLAVRGMLSKGSLGVKNKKKKVFLSISKLLGIFTKCIFHATTTDEKNDILSIFNNSTRIIVAQNLPENKLLPYSEKNKFENQLKMISVGRIAPEKNTLYAIEVLKKVKHQIQFDIYGPIYNEEYWEKCKQVINQLPPNIVVNYKQALPHEKLDATLKNYHALFLPSTGENFGHIILEAMMNSCVPIISDKTPWENLENKQIGFDIPLNNKNSFAEAIDTIANMNQIEYNSISKNANEYALKMLNDEDVIKDYYKLFQL